MTKAVDWFKERRYFGEILTIDKVWFLVLGISTAFLYSHRTDMPLTLMQARDLITAISDGKLSDFYSIVLQKDIIADYGLVNPGMVNGANYNILQYLFLAVLMLPWVIVSKIASVDIHIGWMTQYYEAIFLLLDVYAAVLLVRVCEAFGFARSSARRTAYLFLSSFLLLFSTVGFFQQDIIYIIFLLIALRDYALGRDIPFALWMSFAIMLKTIAIFLFFPLLFLKKKRLLSIVGHSVLGLLFTIINGLIYHGDAGYQGTKELMEAYYHFSERMTNAQIVGNIYPIPIFLVCFILLCVWAYTRDASGDLHALYGQVTFCGLAVYGCFFLFVFWHPQWFCILALFITLATPLVKNKNALFYCEIAASLGYFAITYINWFSTPAELFMINGGILPLLFGKSYNGTGVSLQLIKLSPNIYLYASAILTASLLAMIVMAWRAIHTGQAREEDIYERSLVYLRGMPLLLFNVLVIVAYVYYY